MKHIQIRNSDMAWHIAANIQFPPNFDESKQYPAIISVHPFGSCKEQTSGNKPVAMAALEVVLPTPPLPEVTTIMRAIEIPC
ncbi:hypothetical protein BK349_14645 [Escherichia coli]|nr:hypothetical protein BK349_14645 [Escherichia coli]